jgi:hypothetical protein
MQTDSIYIYETIGYVLHEALTSKAEIKCFDCASEQDKQNAEIDELGAWDTAQPIFKHETGKHTCHICNKVI